MVAGCAWARTALASVKVAGTRLSHCTRVSASLEGGAWRQGVPAPLPAHLGLTALATQRLPQHRDTALGLDDQLQPPVVQVGPLSPP